MLRCGYRGALRGTYRITNGGASKKREQNRGVARSPAQDESERPGQHQRAHRVFPDLRLKAHLVGFEPAPYLERGASQVIARLVQFPA
jgi:hypothetical protein